MKWALIDENNQIVNIIVYDGKSQYEPDNKSHSLVQVNDWLNIGDSITKEKPADDIPPTAEELEAMKKQARNELYKDDLSLKAIYYNQKQSNPDLTFSDMLDKIEAYKVE